MPSALAVTITRTRILVALALTVAGAVLVGLVAWRGTYHNWPWQGDPARVSWCGRHYDIADIDRASELGGGVVHTAFRVPPLVGRAMVTDRRSTSPIAGCAGGTDVVIYLEKPHDRYRAYVLSGGP